MSNIFIISIATYLNLNLILYGTKQNPQQQTQSANENPDKKFHEPSPKKMNFPEQKDQKAQKNHREEPSSYTQTIGRTQNAQKFIDWKNLQEISSYYNNHYNKQGLTNSPVLSTVKNIVPDNSYYFIATNQKNKNNHDQYFTDLYTSDDYDNTDDEYNELDYDHDYDVHNVIKTEGIRVQEPISLQSISKPSSKNQPDDSNQGTQEQRASYDYTSSSSSPFLIQSFELKLFFIFVINFSYFIYL